jgi:hypothetical protein
LMEQPLEQRTYAEDPIYFMRVYLFVMMLSMAYALSQPIPSGNAEKNSLLPDTVRNPSANQGWKDLPSWQRETSVKAVEKYAATQEKKWRRWNEAMFER